jgi:hypothetical protein
MRVLWGQKNRVTLPITSTGLQPLLLTVPMSLPPHPVQACLVTREGEAEPKLQFLIAHRMCIQELRQAAGGKIKEL